MRTTRFPGLDAGLGLLFGLILFFGMSLWFVSLENQNARREAEVRKTTVAAMSLAETVAALETVGAPPEALAPAIEKWREGDALVRDVRLVRQQGAQLVYSSVAADAAKGALPRRLVREEKPLFDLTGQLRGNVESNRAEGYRLPEAPVEGVRDDLLRVTVPIFVGDAYWGIAQVERERSTPAAGGDYGRAGLMLAVAVGVFFALAFVLRAVPLGLPDRWVHLAAVGVLLAVVAVLFGRYELQQLASYEKARASEVAATYQGFSASSQAAAAQVGATVPSTVPLDVDQFRRPLGQIGPDGQLNVPKLDESVSDNVGAIRDQLWWTGLLAAGLAALFALGQMRRLAETVREHRSAYSYVLPAIVGMLLLVFFPFTYGVMLSFTDRTLLNQGVPLTELWVGLDNYVKILGHFDVIRWTADGWSVNYESFYWTLFITICWTVSNVAIGVTLGLMLALALNTENLRGRAIYRVLLILPWAIPNYITALIWKGMFHQQFGVINQAIVMFGGEPVQWFDDVFTSFITGLATNAWLSFPFMMVVSLGALQSIPTDMYEAAKLDGATRWQQFWSITLPLLKPALIPAIILSVVWTFNMFNVIYLVSGGEPAGANEILITKAYKLAFERYQYAYAAAYSFVIFLILLAYGVFQNKVSKATEQVR
ncbi:MAG TPA: sugar ABC transporter permease [Azospirillaceae bacterium]|nr:sugar ABC transporter permease [Azospirillaceae bacterium]